MELWRTQVPWHFESNQRIELFSSASVQYVLYGMCFRTDSGSGRYRDWERRAEMASRLIRQNQALSETLVSTLPTNRDLLDRVRRKT